VAIGVASALHARSTTDDYLVAGRSVAPWLAALSAVATNNSGFMFIGQIAYTYRVGIESVWMMVGWVVGDFVAWLIVHPRVRKHSEEADVATIPALLGSHQNGPRRMIVVLAGLLTFVLLGVYAAAQLKAGSTALQTLFGWDPRLGAIIGAVIVVVYCFSGGIRASIWTDAAQSFVMIVAMATLLIAACLELGGPSGIWENLRGQDPTLVEFMPQNLAFGFAMYLLGMTFGGFGAVGQPHILVRFMAIRSVDEIHRARQVYFLWFIPFFVASIAVGLSARALMPVDELFSAPVTDVLCEPLEDRLPRATIVEIGEKLAIGDLTSGEAAAAVSQANSELTPAEAKEVVSGIQGVYNAASELSMPAMARRLLPNVLIGLTLAGLFAATMSTADSQILVCSGAITQDINPRWKDSYIASKAATFAVTALALAIALFAGQGVFALVLIAWSALGAGIGPALILRLFNVPISSLTVALMMTAGVGTVIAWNMTGYDADIFKLLPGMLASFAVWLISLAFGGKPEPQEATNS